MEDFINEFVLDEDGIYGALDEGEVGIVADSIDEIDDAEFDMEVGIEDEDDIILSMMGICLSDCEEDEEC